MQAHFLGELDARRVLRLALQDLLRFSGSPYGFIAQLIEEGQNRYFRLHSLVDERWTSEQRGQAVALLQAPHCDDAFSALCGHILADGKPVAGAADPQPLLPRQNYLGIPLWRGVQLPGLACLADRPGGYGAEFIEYAQPAWDALGHVLEACLYRIGHDAARALLRESEATYRDLLARLPLVVYRLSLEQPPVPLYVSPPAWEVLGYEAAEYQKNPALWLDQVHPEDRPMLEQRLRESFYTLEGFSLEYRRQHPARGLTWVSEQAALIRDENGNPMFLQGILSNITERHQFEEKQRLAETVFNTIAEAVAITDSAGTILAVNPAFTAITGYAPEEAVGQNPRILSSGIHPPEFYQKMYRQLQQHGHWASEINNRRKNGEVYPEWLSITAVRGHDTKISRYVAIFRDITKHKQTENLLWHHANFDPLTDLPNRILLIDRLGSILNFARLHSQNQLGLLFVDIDRFKWVNESLGHPVGDLMLKEAASRLRSCVQEDSTIARVGADEFVLIVPEISEFGEGEALARQVLKEFAAPFQLAGQEVFLSCSVGIALYPDDGEDPESLLRKADAAMNRAKEGGRNAFRFYAPEIDSQARERMILQRDLRYAIDRKEFVLHYQPLINLATGGLSGAEALVRWKHPSRGLIRPDRFIGVAEETGLIVPISEWVLETACAQTRAWMDAGLPALEMAVNLSRRLFREKNLISKIEDILRRARLPAQNLAIEITETLVMEEEENAVEKMRYLKKLGVRHLLDDFGTGYSSLGYLKHLPVDIIKIDRAFIRDIANHADDANLVNAIIAMAHSLRMEIVAEGVETQAQADFLREAGCEYAQGFLFSFPLPAEEFAKLLLREKQRRHKAHKRAIQPPRSSAPPPVAL
jgi:diguanylate cyclase (GGDEF)-like protein/PAS domain S-box-containing protein